jgi:MFS transporter, FHS family, glucose/mannose:H+ symporter
VVSDISERDKAANLSLLGVFFGLGALSMPFFLGALKNFFSFEGVVATVGLFTLLSALFFFLIRFPPPKQIQGFPLAKSFLLLKDNALILIAFFLFCQSSFEAIINNWTTSYLIKELAIPEKKALFALTLYLAGLTTMRLLLGSVFRSVSSRKLLIASFAQIMLGCVLLKTGNSFPLSVTGLILLGAGLGGGFPIMLGFVGERFTSLSGTAFSFVLFVALLGNMLVNYTMGLIAQAYGIHHLITVAVVELAAMILLSIFILRKINTK